VFVFLLTLTVVAVGSIIATYQNWEIRVDAGQAKMMRTAEIGNLLIEKVLVGACNALNAVQRDFDLDGNNGNVSSDKVSKVLNKSWQNFNAYNNSDALGLIYWINAQGLLIAKTGSPIVESIDLSDQFYFKDLKNNRWKNRTVGPLVLDRTNGKRVFHFAIPVQDEGGNLIGVLAQQVIEEDIISEIKRYEDTVNFLQMKIFYNSNRASLQFPPSTNMFELETAGDISSAFEMLQSQPEKGSGIFSLRERAVNTKSIVGFSRSSFFGMTTLVSMPVEKFFKLFLIANQILILYILLGIAFLVGIFFVLFRFSVQLMIANEDSLHDQLTNLYNRRAVDDRLPKLMRNSKRTQTPISVLFVDIDFFRRFNEEYGHACGDRALQYVAGALDSCCRRPMDFICRWGGEEFVVVLPQTNQAAAVKIANDMLVAVRSLRIDVPNDVKQLITVSIGTVTITVNNSNFNMNLVDAADKAMKQAKDCGRDQYFISTNVELPQILQLKMN